MCFYYEAFLSNHSLSVIYAQGVGCSINDRAGSRHVGAEVGGSANGQAGSGTSGGAVMVGSLNAAQNRVAQSLDREIRGALGAGERLDGRLASALEDFYGADLSQVRIHADE